MEPKRAGAVSAGAGGESAKRIGHTSWALAQRPGKTASETDQLPEALGNLTKILETASLINL